jgi:hypothetical protein
LGSLLNERWYHIDGERLQHYDFLPSTVRAAVLGAILNGGHGYWGLSQCLELPFVGVGWGLGHSAVLTRNAEAVFGYEQVYQYSYFDRLVTDYGSSPSLWITAYPSVASDVTFPGSLLVWFIVGRLLAQAWLAVVARPDALAAMALAWLFYTLAMTPMNFPPGDIGSFPSFYGCLIAWVLLRRGRRRRKIIHAA